MQVVLEILFDVFLFMLVDSQEVLVKKYGLSPWLAWAVRLSALAAVMGASLWWYYRS